MTEEKKKLQLHKMYGEITCGEKKYIMPFETAFIKLFTNLSAWKIEIYGSI